MRKLIALLFATTLSLQIAVSVAGANESDTVSSRTGWQSKSFSSPVKRISGIVGGWSVDDAKYHRVGPAGHYGNSSVSLSPYNDRKFDRKYPFGALLIEVEGKGYMYVTGPMDFQEPVRQIRVRINDRDDSLGDNGGDLTIWFEN